MEKVFKQIPDFMKFQGNWRSYQEAFLEEISYHLSDKKLNVVAAPGAGKTTLGIEIVKRLNKPALVLAPTITIKNQWKQRIVESFLPCNTDESWISTDVRDIRVITSTTYQAVHSILKNEKLYKTFVDELKQRGIKTLVLDEAHHLRTEWYQTLSHLCSCLDSADFTVVSLTATPPYDVVDSEWENYSSLCGPVDVEISIPELVKNGDLCYHQDILLFSDLSAEEKNIVYDFQANRQKFFEYINFSSDFSYSVKSSDFVQCYQEKTELIYDDVNFTIALISYLSSIDDMSIEAKILTEFLCIPKESIPPFDYSVAETLFNGILGKYKKHFKNVPLLKSKLKEYGLLKTSASVDFKGETDFKKLYARSVNKLSSISEISKIESDNLKENLREVILLDYIGKNDALGLSVHSVFDTLFEQNPNQRLGILTGTLVVIPENAKAAMYALLEKFGLKQENVLTASFKHGFLRVETYGGVSIVPVITELFSMGEIRVLTGTQALLGEGWDAPCINTLIIASSVGSFMLSNQMRGRALRVDKNNSDKTANIWHLISLSEIDDNPDLEIVKKRFETFEGISFTDEKIQNGINRLGYNFEDIRKIKCRTLNEYSFKLAKQRNQLCKKWTQVFEESNYTEKNLRPKVYESIQISDVQLPVICYKNFKNPLYKIFRTFIAKKCIEKQQEELFGIAEALLTTLCEIRAILTPIGRIKITNKVCYNNYNKSSESFLTINGCSNYERNIFIKALNEMFCPPQKQRYILKKEMYKGKKYIGTRYIIVPDIVGTKSRNVKLFKTFLESILGYTDSIFTRNPEGRKEFLKAKLAIQGDSKIKKAKIWI